MDTEKYIKKAREVHGDKYDYKYIRDYRFEITCPKHGKFEKLIYHHISRGQGCPECSREKKAFSLKDFIQMAREVHCDKYDYSLVEYVNSYTKVKIICPEHGVFEQVPYNHVNNKNICPKCKSINHGKIMKKTLKKFIQEAKRVHGDRYEYSLVEYVGSLDKVKIICPEHGVFEQRPNHHINIRNGCPACSQSHGEWLINDFLNRSEMNFERQYFFNNCRNKQALPFDFYLPKLNMCIEYDGKQHYESVEYFGGEKTLKYIQQNDEIKNRYCKSNNIKLIRIKYDEDIEKKLKEALREWTD